MNKLYLKNSSQKLKPRELQNLINDAFNSESNDSWGDKELESPIEEVLALHSEQKLPSNPNIVFKPLDSFGKIIIKITFSD